MVRSCSVPRCRTIAGNVTCCKNKYKRNSLHSLPYTCPSRWKEWLIKCPFYKNFSRLRLENAKICNKHFIPQHIFEKDDKRRLTKDAVPLLKLPDFYNGNIADQLIKDKKAFEIYPVQSNEPVNFKIVDYDPGMLSKTKQTYKNKSVVCIDDGYCDKDRIEVHIKAGETFNLPVDHNMYTIHMTTEDTLESLSTESGQHALKQPSLNDDILEEKRVKEDIIQSSDVETLDYIPGDLSLIGTDISHKALTICPDKHSYSLSANIGHPFSNELLEKDKMDIKSEMEYNENKDDILNVFANESSQKDVDASRWTPIEWQDQNCDLSFRKVPQETVQEKNIGIESNTQVTIFNNSDGYNRVDKVSPQLDVGSSEQEQIEVKIEDVLYNLKSEEICNLPIDHNMDTLFGQTRTTSKCLSNEKDQHMSKLSNVCILQEKIKDEIIELSNDRIHSMPVNCTSSQFISDISQNPLIECYNQLSDFISPYLVPPLDHKFFKRETKIIKSETQAEPFIINGAMYNKVLNTVAVSSHTDSDPDFITGCHEQSLNSFSKNITKNSNEIPNIDSKSNSSEQSQINLTHDVFKLTSKSAEPKTVKPLCKLRVKNFLIENNNQPIYSNLEISSLKDNCSRENSSADLEIISSNVNRMHSLVKKSSNKQMLESLVAQLLDSVDSETTETCTESQFSSNTDTKKNTKSYFNRKAISSNKVQLNYDINTANERKLRDHNDILKSKLRNLTNKYSKLKLRTTQTFAEAKQFLKNYSVLSDKGKLLVDLQLRLARVPQKLARYSVEEKKFAVNLHNISSDGYRFLQEYIKLPVKSTFSTL